MNKWQFSIKKRKRKKNLRIKNCKKNVNELRVTIIKILFVRFSFKCYRLDHICIMNEMRKEKLDHVEKQNFGTQQLKMKKKTLF